MNVKRKMYVVVVNEEKQKMKQPSIFGGIVKDNTKFYCSYKSPNGAFESVAERFCLREKKKTRKQNKDSVAQANKFWKEIKTDEKKIEEFLKLRPGEKPFVRSGVLSLYCSFSPLYFY